MFVLRRSVKMSLLIEIAVLLFEMVLCDWYNTYITARTGVVYRNKTKLQSQTLFEDS